MSMFTPNTEDRFNNASLDAKMLLADMLAGMILNSESIPEESKIEVRIMDAYRKFDTRLTEVFKGYSCPIPGTEAGKEVQKRVYPARQAFLEWLQLTAAGLESLLAVHPVPDIPPEFRKAAEQPPEWLR